MISIYLPKKIKISNLLAGFVIVLLATFPLCTFAQTQAGALSLSVSPTLFEMAASPLQAWNSSVKVINNNRYPITVYASVVNFAPQGETGHGKFMPVFENFTDGSTLAEWISITDEPITVQGEKSIQVPFNVSVPENASPGGHFAAIMIGTKPPESADKIKVQTSQIVTSLFFVRIAGDVVEDGNVREFRTVKSFVQSPKANFSVRFENKGNVHIQPQGEILITNMWGKERGIIPINHETHFGNVLPNSIRNFEFTWKGESRFTDIGRYKAILTLAYGSESRKFATSTAYFWVIPVKPVITVFGVLLATAFFIMWSIKAYVRRMISLSGYTYEPTAKQPLRREGDVLIQKKTSIKSPVTAGVTDLKVRLAKTKAFTDTIKTLSGFVWQYKLFFVALLFFILLVTVLWYFFATVTEKSRDYEVTIENANADVTISSEEILHERNKSQTEGGQVETLNVDPGKSIEDILDAQLYSLILVNSSDTPGLAGQLQDRLDGLYRVDALRSDFGDSRAKTAIVYHSDYIENALALSRILGGALLSALPADSEEEEAIIIYIGNDYSAE